MKYCEDCKHLRLSDGDSPNGRVSAWRCHQQPVKMDDSEEPVFRPRPVFITAKLARSRKGFCGPEGRKFEAK